MGRRKVPTAKLQATSRRPMRDAADEPEPIPVPKDWEPPKHLTPGERLAWAQIVRDALPGVLSSSDALQVETAAVLMAEMRKSRAKFTRFKDLMNALDRLGLSPSGRAGVRKPQPKPGERTGFGALRDEARH